MGEVIPFNKGANSYPKKSNETMESARHQHTYDDLVRIMQFYTSVVHKKEVVETALKCLSDNLGKKNLHPVLPAGLAYLYSSEVRPNSIKLLELTSPNNPYLKYLVDPE